MQPPTSAENRHPQLKKAFVWASALAMGAFLVVQVFASVQADAGSARLTRLMGHIGADLVDLPMTPTQLSMPLELPPGGDQDTFTLAELPPDTLIFLNFWATWCKPCRDELPSMFKLRRELQSRRFAMVAVSYDDSWEEIISFFQRFVGRMPRPGELFVVRDPATEEEQMLRTYFGTSKLPDSYVLQNDRILARFVNARDWANPAIVQFFELLDDR